MSDPIGSAGMSVLVTANSGVRCHVPDIISPRDYAADRPVETLVQWWSEARSLSYRAASAGEPADPGDYIRELALGARIAAEVTCGRWPVVARMLQAGAVECWREIGDALDMPADEARKEFLWWVSGQVDVYQQTNRFGLTHAEADELTALAEGVAW